MKRFICCTITTEGDQNKLVCLNALFFRPKSAKQKAVAQRHSRNSGAEVGSAMVQGYGCHQKTTGRPCHEGSDEVIGRGPLPNCFCSVLKVSSRGRPGSRPRAFSYLLEMSLATETELNRPHGQSRQSSLGLPLPASAPRRRHYLSHRW